MGEDALDVNGFSLSLSLSLSPSQKLTHSLPALDGMLYKQKDAKTA